MPPEVYRIDSGSAIRKNISSVIQAIKIGSEKPYSSRNPLVGHKKGYTEIRQLAERFGVTEEFVKRALYIYEHS